MPHGIPRPDVSTCRSILSPENGAVRTPRGSARRSGAELSRYYRGECLVADKKDQVPEREQASPAPRAARVSRNPARRSAHAKKEPAIFRLRASSFPTKGAEDSCIPASFSMPSMYPNPAFHPFRTSKECNRASESDRFAMLGLTPQTLLLEAFSRPSERQTKTAAFAIRSI